MAGILLAQFQEAIRCRLFPANSVKNDHLLDECDATIAVDVIPTPAEECGDSPNMVDAILGMLDAMVAQLTNVKLATKPPTIYVRPRLTNIRALDFMKVGDVWEQAMPAMTEFREDLDRMNAQTAVHD